MRIGERALRTMSGAIWAGAALWAVALPSFAAPIEAAGLRITFEGPGRVLESPDGLLIEAERSVYIESLSRFDSPQSGSLTLWSPVWYPTGATRTGGSAVRRASGGVVVTSLPSPHTIAGAYVDLSQAPLLSNASLTPITGGVVVTAPEPPSLESEAGGVIVTQATTRPLVWTMPTNPEPGTGLLLAFGLGLLGGRRARRSRRPQS